MKQGNWGHFGVAMDALERLLNCRVKQHSDEA
jgi:hypothetical protein